MPELLAQSGIMKTILVVEDDEVTAHILKFVLEREKIEVLVATDGRQALEKVNTQAPVDLIILDIMLPYINGLQLIPHIRNQPTWQDVPILMLTTNANEQTVVDALDAGANDYVIKPFRAQELKARVRRFLRLAQDGKNAENS